ncbi:DUF397 domain-containing protein [Nocardia australiensis]|uniref:DUF397 domain-containing protein n=1 Tax=Nocardia australiensis TaxID=2887191 RepID=UPI001D14CC25|nr:DUF397 domain-containing protein [Nocardia australiensis]
MEVDFTDAVWRKSTHSGPDGNCVEVAFLVDGKVAVRDTKNNGYGPVLAFAPGRWDEFLRRVAAGEF